MMPEPVTSYPMTYDETRWYVSVLCDEALAGIGFLIGRLEFFAFHPDRRPSL